MHNTVSSLWFEKKKYFFFVLSVYFRSFQATSVRNVNAVWENCGSVNSLASPVLLNVILFTTGGGGRSGGNCPFISLAQLQTDKHTTTTGGGGGRKNTHFQNEREKPIQPLSVLESSFFFFDDPPVLHQKRVFDGRRRRRTTHTCITTQDKKKRKENRSK